MRHILFALSAVLMMLPTMAAAMPDSQLISVRADVILDGNSDLFEGTASSVQWIEPRGQSTGTIWAGSSSGIRVGGIGAGADGVEVEIPYSITVFLMRNRSVQLQGVGYMLTMSDGDLIDSGRKIRISQQTRLDQPALIPLGYLPDGVGISLQLTVSYDEQDIATDHDSPVRLITVARMDGELISRHGAGYAFCRTIPVVIDFEAIKDATTSSMLRYTAEIKLSDNPATFGRRTPLTVTINRCYQVNQEQQGTEPFKSTGSYVSTHTHTVDVVPGRTLKLVIPPDTPSVWGYEITDTLVIVPPQR